MIRTTSQLGLVLLLLITLTGCGGAGSGNASKPTVEGIPTPQGAFAQATTVITPQAAATAAPESGGGDPVAGKTVYDNKCASCHGAKGEGVEGKGKGAASWTMPAADFDDILRTGAKGKLGNEHLYGPSQISPSGMTNLFAFVRSLQKK